jgi:hypothetical protein
MSSRVSVPTTARLIGLAQPPRPSPLRAGPRGLVVGSATGIILPPSSHALVARVRNLSASILSPTCAGAHLRLRLTPLTASLRPLLALLSPRSHFAVGSLRRIPTHAHAAALGVAAARTDRDYLPRFVSCRGSASRVSCRIVLGHPPSEVSPRRRRTTLSSRAVLHAVPHLAVSQLRGFQLPVGCVLRRRRCSRLRRAAPLLVVFPLRGCLPASPHTSAGLLSWASIMRSSSCFPLRFVTSHMRTCALQSFREPEVRLV